MASETSNQSGTAVNEILNAEAVTVRFGGLVAVNDVSLSIAAGQVFGIIGPNGAGKTTLFNTLTGLTQPSAGRILFAAKDITKLPPWQRVRGGMARTFQNIRLFAEMTVFQTVLIGSQACRKASPVAHLLGTPGAQKDEHIARKRASEEIAFVGLSKKTNTGVKNLSYGDRRRVEIARALAANPTLLLLDEPAAGMNPQECNELVGVIENIRDRDITVVLVEHHMRVVMSVCDRIAVLDHGIKIAEGLPEEIRTNPKIIEAYLGKGVATHAKD